MTTTIKVTSHNYPALVEIFDKQSDGTFVKVDYAVLTPESGEQSYYCTTTRMVQVTDLDHDAAPVGSYSKADNE